MSKTHYAKMYSNAKWYEKIVLYFIGYTTHESIDGYVVYKVFRDRIYVYAHAHYSSPKNYDNGHSDYGSN